MTLQADSTSCSSLLTTSHHNSINSATRYINLYRSIERVHALYITPYTYKHQACSSIGLALYSSNHTTRICWRFAVDLLADRLYSKSTAFCHQRICLQHILTCRYIADKSVVSPATPFDMVQNGRIYSKSTACGRLAADLL